MLDEEIEISLTDLACFQRSKELDILFDVVDDELLSPPQKTKTTTKVIKSSERKLLNTQLDKFAHRVQKEVLLHEEKKKNNLLEDLVMKKELEKKAVLLSLSNQAPILRRIFGFIVDLTVILTLSGVLFYFSFLSPEVRSGLLSQPTNELWYLLIKMPTFVMVFLTTWILISSLLTSMSGQTPGQKLFGAQTLNTEGNIPGLYQATLRSLSQLTTLLTLGFGIVPLFGPKKRPLHDLLSGTVVVNANSQTSQPLR